MGSRTFTHAASSVWNSVLQDLKEKNSIISFKTRIKDALVQVGMWLLDWKSAPLSPRTYWRHINNDYLSIYLAIWPSLFSAASMESYSDSLIAEVSCMLTGLIVVSKLSSVFYDQVIHYNNNTVLYHMNIAIMFKYSEVFRRWFMKPS